jgi:hypothetical protein
VRASTFGGFGFDFDFDFGFGFGFGFSIIERFLFCLVVFWLDVI